MKTRTLLRKLLTSGVLFAAVGCAQTDTADRGDVDARFTEEMRTMRGGDDRGSKQKPWSVSPEARATERSLGIGE